MDSLFAYKRYHLCSICFKSTEGSLRCFLLFYLGTAPFNSGKALAFKRLKALRLDLFRLIHSFPRHEYTQQALGRRRDLKLRRIRIDFRLERNEIIRIVFHFRQPIDDKLVRFLFGQADFGECLFQERGGFSTGNRKACGKIVFRIGYALPEQTVVFSTVFIIKRTVKNNSGLRNRRLRPGLGFGLRHSRQARGGERHRA